MAIMIFDRTAEDVAQAKKIRADKIRNGVSITEDERAILEKGMLTPTTIRRIEEKQREIADTIYNMGYTSFLVDSKVWSDDDFFLRGDLERICKNNNELRKAYYVLVNTPADARPVYRYTEINALERILNDIDEVIEDMQSRYKICGTVNCGGAM